jgi:RimJ/RimL family protein N-acetyltransferase
MEHVTLNRAMSGPVSHARPLEVPDGGLSDGVVRLRPWQTDDEDWVYETCSSDEEISRWTRVPSPYRRQDAQDFLARATNWWAAGTDATFLITDLADGVRLGAAGLHRIGGEDHGDELADEVGYWLAADARGRGYATRAVRLVCDWAFGVLGRPAVVLQVAIGNDRSVAVAQRAGFGAVPALAVDETGRPRDDLLAFRRDAPR